MQVIVKKRDIQKELDALFAATKDRERGSLIKHEELESISGIERYAPGWASLVRKWKRLMLGRGVWVKAAFPAGVGYRFLTVEEQLEHEPERFQRRRDRLLRREAECVGSIEVDNLTDSQVSLQQARLTQLAAVRTMSQTHRAELASWLSNPKALPKPT